MLAPLFGYFFYMITVLTAAAVLLTGVINISPSPKGTQHFHPPTIGRTVLVETQRHSPVAREDAPAKEVVPVAGIAKADAKETKHFKPKLVARQRNNYGYGTALGYAQQSGYAPRGAFFQ